MKLVVGALVLVTGLTAPAIAQVPGYVAVPEVAPAKTNVITRSTLWKCAGASCTTPRSDERTAVLCQLAAREMGRLVSFTAAGEPLDADALARCNTRAR